MGTGDRWSAVTALADASRRMLYDYVSRQCHPVTREEAADAARMSRALAAFHLDKLVEAGLLHARYEAPAGQPRGRGRAPKVYQAVDVDLAVSIPERRYELIAEILADAVAEDPEHADRAARRLAHQRGQQVGTRWRGADLHEALADLGFQPERAEGGATLLRNCPFHALATRRTDLVCGLNHELLSGLVEGMGLPWIRARLVPRPGACCVQLDDE